MALTLQRKLELAGDLAKVQPLLQRLHLMEKPKKRHRARNVILVGSAICSAAVVVVMVRRRRGRDDDAIAGSGGDAQADPPTQEPAHEFDQSDERSAKHAVSAEAAAAIVAEIDESE